MGKRKDDIWDHVENLNGRFKCNYCKREFSGGISRIKSHLSGIKARGIDIYLEVSSQVKAAAALLIEGPIKKAKMSGSSTDQHDDQTIFVPSESSSKGLVNRNVMPKINEKDKSAVNVRLAKFCISNNIGFDVVESQSFVDFVKGVADYGPGYELPDSSTLQDECIPDLKVEVEEYVNCVKKSWTTTGCTIMLDVWGNFVSAVAYFHKGPIFVKAYEISKIKQNKDIINCVSSIIVHGIDSVVQIVTNNNLIFDSVGDLIVNKYPRIYRIRCAAEELHSLLKNIYEQVD